MKRASSSCALTALLAVLALAGCGSGTVTVRGGMIVRSQEILGDSCRLSDTGFADIAAGAQVVVTAPDGTVIGSGALRSPVVRSATACYFPFTVAGVHGGEARYGVEVASRGTVWFGPPKIADAVEVVK